MTKSIYVIGEPLHEKTYWYTMMMDAINRRAAYRRQQVISITSEELDKIPPACAPVIVVGATRPWQDRLVNHLLSRNLRCVLLSTHFQSVGENVSVITLNQGNMSEYAVHYFRETNRRRIAYVAHNPRSINDSAKFQAMTQTCRRYGMQFDENDIFPFDGDLEKCVQSFVDRCEPYDAVLCSSDVSGVMLVKNPQLMQKKRIPEDLYVISYGNTLLSKLVSPSLSSITLDYYQAGTIAVDNVIYLRKNPGISSQYTVLKARLVLGASTNFESIDTFPLPPISPLTAGIDYPGFYHDPVAKDVLGVEALLNSLDKTGLYILLTLLKGYRKAQILDSLYIAESTYKYRLNKIYAMAGVKRKEELLARLQKWIDPDSLDDFLARQSMMHEEDDEIE